MYLSYFIGKPIKDNSGKELGKLEDLVVRPSRHLPVITAVVVKTGKKKTMTIGYSHFDFDKDKERFTLKCRKEDLAEDYQYAEDDILLKTNTMDKQIVDVHDYRVVRVNDVRIEKSGANLYFVGVDTGTRGLVRRMGLMHIADFFSKIFRIKVRSKIIGWHDLETFERGMDRIKLRVPSERLKTMHPSDIAKIVNDMDPDQRNDILEGLDLETAADVLTEAHSEVQASIVESLEDEYAADILEEMEPDEAADILGDISEERREDILEEMEPEEAEDVKELLIYEDQTAGGLMTTEFVAVPKDNTAQMTIEHIREVGPEAEMIYYLYVVDSLERLAGVISLRDLIVAQPETPVTDFMVDKIISVHVDAEVEEIFNKLTDYNLLALPVVDEENHLKGMITVDDVLEEIFPEDTRKRYQRFRP